MGLIQNQIRPLFPNFAAALSRQSPVEREIGRCAVVEFNQGFAQRTSSFESSEELRHYLLKTSPSPAISSQSQPQRRLFILEDLPQNYILTLGSRLRIPPSFFAGHYDDPATSTFNHRNPFERHTKSQFRLRYETRTAPKSMFHRTRVAASTPSIQTCVGIFMHTTRKASSMTK
jgi:hypothetical protein